MKSTAKKVLAFAFPWLLWCAMASCDTPPEPTVLTRGLDTNPAGTGDQYLLVAVAIDKEGNPLLVPKPTALRLWKLSEINDYFRANPLSEGYSVLLFYYPVTAKESTATVRPYTQHLDSGSLQPHYFYLIKLNSLGTAEHKLQTLDWELDPELTVLPEKTRAFVRSLTVLENRKAQSQPLPVPANPAPQGQGAAGPPLGTPDAIPPEQQADSVPASPIPSPEDISFRADVLPLLQRLCQKDCHDNKVKKGGFSVEINAQTHSIDAIHSELTKDKSKAMPLFMRVDTNAPSLSLLLTKPVEEDFDPEGNPATAEEESQTVQVGGDDYSRHEGGDLFTAESDEYTAIFNWISGGAKNN